MFSPLDPACPPDEAVAAVAIVTDFFLLLEELFTDAVVVDADAAPVALLPPFPADNTEVRGGAGAAVLEEIFGATAETGSTPAERGGIVAVGSATGGRAGMLESMISECIEFT